MLWACGGDQLQVDAERAHSQAAAATLLASQAADGKLTTPYVRAHAEELAEAAQELARQIRSDPGDAGRRDAAAAIADATAEGMRRLAANPDDRRTAAEVEAVLRQAMR